MNSIIDRLKSYWDTFKGTMANPWKSLKEFHSKSPIIMILSIVFIIQPVVSFIIDMVGNIHFVEQELDPDDRPATEGEIKLLNQKLDALAQNSDVEQYKQLQDKLHNLQNRLNSKYMSERHHK